MKMSLKMQFLLKNGAKGLASILIMLGLYLLFKEFILSRAPDAWVDKIYARPSLVYLSYTFSEFFFGLIPPELFMIWAINKDTIAHYFMNLGFFAIMSYIMGYLAFLVGRAFYKRPTFRLFRIKFLKKLWPMLKKYGLFLIIIAALTPLPWSVVCMLVGSAGYSSNKFLKYGIARLIRFAIYGYIIFQTHTV